jgi:hypothetical protein
MYERSGFDYDKPKGYGGAATRSQDIVQKPASYGSKKPALVDLEKATLIGKEFTLKNQESRFNCFLNVVL